MALFAKSVITHQTNVLNMLISPMLGAQGVEYKPASVSSSRTRKPRSDRSQFTEAEATAREERMMEALSRVPIGVRTVQTSGNEPG